MNFKKIVLATINVFIIASISHFGYTVFPCFITSIFFPVNESIFEHLKMLFTAEVFFTISEFLIKRKDRNPVLRALIRGYLAIFILLLLYLPVDYLIGEVLPVTLLILFITIFLTECIVRYIPRKKHYSFANTYSVVFLLLTYILFTYFTYHPLHEKLFWDEKHKQYGIVSSDQ